MLGNRLYVLLSIGKQTRYYITNKVDFFCLVGEKKGKKESRNGKAGCYIFLGLAEKRSSRQGGRPPPKQKCLLTRPVAPHMTALEALVQHWGPIYGTMTRYGEVTNTWSFAWKHSNIMGSINMILVRYP